ncbi:MAG: hypothetical protein AABZ53_08610 [Planctomycetota bacterium]
MPRLLVAHAAAPPGVRPRTSSLSPRPALGAAGSARSRYNPTKMSNTRLMKDPILKFEYSNLVASRVDVKPSAAPRGAGGIA